MMTMLIQDTIVMLCKNMIKYELELSVEGLLGVTVDRKDIVLINIKELVTNAMNSQSSPTPVSGDNSPDLAQTKRKRPRVNRPFVSSATDQEKQTTTKVELLLLGVPRCTVEDARMSGTEECAIMIDEDNEKRRTLKLENIESNSNHVVEKRTKVLERTSPVEVLNAEMNLVSSAVVNNFVSWQCGLPPPRREPGTKIKKETLDGVLTVSQDIGKDSRSGLKFEPHNREVDEPNVTFKHSSFPLSTTGAQNPCVDYNSSQQSWVTFDQQDESAMDPSPQPTAANGDSADMLDLDSICGTARDMNGTVSYHCVICSQTFTARHHVRRHYNSQHSCAPEHYFCQLCGAGFRRLDVMRRHAKSVHKDMDCSVWLNLDIGSANTVQ